MKFPIVPLETTKLNEGAILEVNCVCLKTGGLVNKGQTVLITDIDVTEVSKNKYVEFRPIKDGKVEYTKKMYTLARYLKIVMTARDYLEQELLKHLKESWGTVNVKSVINDVVVKFYCTDKPNVLMYHNNYGMLNAVGVTMHTLERYKKFIREGVKWRI